MMVFSIFLLIVGVLLAAFWGDSLLVGGGIGLLIGWVYQLMLRIRQLEADVKRLILQESAPTQILASVPEPELAQALAPEPSLGDLALTPVDSMNSANSANLVDSVLIPVPVAAVSQASAHIQAEQATQTEPPSLSIWSKAKAWLVGGNPFVRLGIVILFLGVVFLLRYSIQHNLVPIELRLLASAGAAVVLLGLGWRLRTRVGAYGLILQAGGIGLLYLTIFGAHSLYQLMPAWLAFSVLLLIVLAGAALAVLQNSLPLAVFATVGGFLAPLLTSSGSNNYIGLFSFYALLNLGIVLIAWFKSWRLLNLVGFVFTFVIAGFWGWFSYRAENFWATEGFLILFFLFYVLIAILFATRSPFNLKSKVDGSLVFGTAIIGFCMQVGLFLPLLAEGQPVSFLSEYGLAISTVVLSLFYLSLAALLWRRYAETQRLLAETFLVLGVIFATLTIPFAVQSAAITTAAWAIEGAGIIWLGIRQQQFAQRLVAVILQFFSLFILVLSLVASIKSYPYWWDGGSMLGFIDGLFLASSLIALAMLAASRLLSDEFIGKRRFETGLAMSLLISALVVHFLSFELQIAWSEFDYPIHWHLLYATVVIVLLLLSTRHYWRLLSWVLPLPILVFSLAWLIMLVTGSSLFSAYLIFVWGSALGVWYGLLWRLEQRAWFSTWLKIAHTFTLWLIMLLLMLQLQIWLKTYFAMENAWPIAAIPLIPLTMIWLILKAPLWPFKTQRPLLFYTVVLPNLLLVMGWFLLSLGMAGYTEPLPWLPVLNPLDLVTIYFAITLIMVNQYWQPENLKIPTLLVYSLAFIGFAWLNLTVLRVLHHWYGLAWEFPSLLINPITQTTLALIWGISGLLLTWRGNRTGKRSLWSAGAVLLAAVILKLFLFDFASSDTVERIISFIGVGVLLLFIGYLAPLPPAPKAVSTVVTKELSDAE